jgi:archaemetzincin
MPGNRNAKNLLNHIIISPIGHFDPQLITEIGREVHRITGCSPLTASVLQDIDFAFESIRNQHYSTPILEKLADLAPPGTVKILAICSVDLFIPILTYIYGEAQLGGKACIISTHRLNEGLGTAPSEIFIQRVVKEAIHELGHTFNLRHCKDHACCMHYCRTIKDVDRKTHQLCRYCKVLLEDEMKRMAKIGSRFPV